MSNWQHDGEVRTPDGGYEPRREPDTAEDDVTAKPVVVVGEVWRSRKDPERRVRVTAVIVLPNAGRPVTDVRYTVLTGGRPGRNGACFLSAFLSRYDPEETP